MHSIENKKYLVKFERLAKQIAPIALDPKLEDEAKLLYEYACCGSRKLWSPAFKSIKESKENKYHFYKSAHEGMWNAQNLFIKKIQGQNALSPSENYLYRSAMDTIAWQLIQRELCYARRLYREKKQPTLTNSNFQSVVNASKSLRASKSDLMPLISDLTSFVQIGDLFVADPDSGISIIEVKEGEKNSKVYELADFYRKSGCEDLKRIVFETESKSTFKQFERMLRQMERMDYAKKILNEGKAYDPDLKQEILIPGDIYPMKHWSLELNELLDRAIEKGWAVNVIDECLFVGAYASNQAIKMSPFTFLTWLECFGEVETIHISRLADSTFSPLALPLFALPIPTERMLDILFGRIHVCMGFSISNFVLECERIGILARPPNNKNERRTVNSLGSNALIHNGKRIVLEKNGKVMYIANGILMRMFFHLQRPMSIINAYFDSDLVSP